MQENKQELDQILEIIKNHIKRDIDLSDRESILISIRFIELMFRLDLRGDKYTITLWSRGVYQELLDYIKKKVEK